MKSATNKIKRVFTLLLIFLLFINSFMSIASDNDGSAFITKAEFDSLKNQFQSQLDGFNLGIDSKIDDAIAAYLSGMRVKTSFTRALLCDNETGVIESAVGNDTFPWILGDPSIAMQTCAQTQKSGTWAVYFRFEGLRNGQTTPFYERIITDVDYVYGTGKWYGYCETNQVFTLYGQYEDWTVDSTASANKPQISYVNGWTAFTNKNFNSGETGEIIRFGMSPTTPWGYNLQFIADTATSGFARLYNGVPKHKYLNCFDSNLGAYRFSNYTIRDFSNDVFPSDHGPEVKHIDEIFPDSRNVVYYGMKTKSGDAKWYTSSANYSINNWQSTQLNNPVWTYPTCYNLPYIGFVNDIRNWGRIWTDKYDSIMDDVLKKNPSVSHVSVSKASGNVNHLNLDAGTPMFQIEGSGIYSVDIEFDDAGDHGVWFKKNGWARQARPCDQTDNLKCKNASDFTILNGDGYEVPNGEKKTFEFEFTNADIGSCVFMSWSTISGPVTDWHGGGTLKIPENYAANIVK